ncbi:hypothetical protein [Stutzerimonas nitrititolerans]|uniref:hypothetical protein n=1 Tax=Stutzerimonas nitrititolerans TaxID=2482751 RepID=UPI002897FCD5|nr:hypothetical protein [Stutzerimonas nitrititolerans]
MKYINNYREAIELAAGATIAALSLPDGDYRLTLTSAEGDRWEIVDAAVVAGIATLARAREGTLDQGWPAGSSIYCDVTAGQLNDLLARISDLQQRVAALEGGSAPDGALVDSSGSVLVDGEGNFLTTEIA